MDAAERRHVERLSAMTPAGREILCLVERERKLREALEEVLAAVSELQALQGVTVRLAGAAKAARALLKEEQVMRVIDQWIGDGGFMHRLREHADGGLDVQYLDGNWQNIGDRAALYRLKEVLGERLSGAGAERARIRRELLAEIGTIPPSRLGHSPQAAHVLREIRKAVDRICPEEG